jgi:hypothetical protein
MSSSILGEPARRDALESSTSALRRLAGYTLPPELDRRILELGERRESLSPQEKAELMAWVKFTQERSLEKAEAEVALQRLASGFPELAGRP